MTTDPKESAQLDAMCLAACSCGGVSAGRACAVSCAIFGALKDAVTVQVLPPTICSRCKNQRECRDVLGNGTKICFQCSTEPEREAYGRRLFGIV